MKDNKIQILHVFLDGLIFSNVADAYNTLEGVNNLYYYYTPKKDFQFQNVNDERVRIISNFDEYVGYFSDPEIDVILFYSLPYQNYYLFDYIDDKKFVIWWAWGYDIYYSQGKNPPLIPLKEMYMPLTKAYMMNHSDKSNICDNLLTKIYRLPKAIYFRIRGLFNHKMRPQKSQKEIISRIDAFYAPLDIEYDLIKEKQKNFRAKRIPRISSINKIPFKHIEKPGNILINHSLTYTDNHLDIFEVLKNVELKQPRKYILPVSYGIDGYGGNPENLIKESHLDDKTTMWLTKVLPNKEYQAILESVSHAVFGALRQQALGNIFLCLNRGVKVYLYSDSYIYKELKKQGFVIFSIEKDLNENSLSKCLSKENAKINHDIREKMLSQTPPEKLREFLVEAVAEKARSEEC